MYVLIRGSYSGIYLPYLVSVNASLYLSSAVLHVSWGTATSTKRLRCSSRGRGSLLLLLLRVAPLVHDVGVCWVAECFVRRQGLSLRCFYRPPARPPAPRDAKSRKKRGASCSCCAAWPLGARLRVAVLGSNVNASATYDSLLVLHSFSSLFSESELEPFAQGMERSPAVSRRRIAPRTHGICPPQEGRRRLGCRLLSAVGSPNQVERYNYRAFSFSASVEWLEIFRRGHLEPLSAEYASTCMSCSFGATDCRTINLAHRPCCCCGRCCCSDHSCCRTTRDYKLQEFPLPRSLGRDGLRTRKALGWL